MDSQIQEIEKEAAEFFEDVNPAHDWHHVKRVYRIASRLAEKEGADEKVVKSASLLHDIGRKKEDQGLIENHAEWGAEEAQRILKDVGFKESSIESVVHCIRSHRYSTTPEPSTLEAKVLSDADNLDALGATGIARTFTYGGEHRSTIADLELPVEKDSNPVGETSLNHLQKKILKLKNRMYTRTGQEIAQERHKFVEEFVERLKDEIRGEK